MLLFTYTMKSLLFLVCTNVLVLIQCQAIPKDEENIYEATPKTYTYPNSDIEDYYQSIRRLSIHPYQYNPSEETNQATSYPDSQHQEQVTENYPSTQKNIRQQISRRRTQVKKPQVEQYLKEVTPTTKTVYNTRYVDYVRLNEQAPDTGIKQETEGLQRAALKPSIQYVLQSDVQQKPSRPHPQLQYVIPEQKPVHPEQQPNAASLAAYQNALLAHQKVLETERIDESARSSIYVTQSIPKKPVRKTLKPATQDENIQQYTRLPQYEFQQKPPAVYERQEPAEVMYQAKLQYANNDRDYQASTEAPTYLHILNNKALKQQQLQYQKVSTEEPTYQEEKIQQQPLLPSYQQLLSRPGKSLHPVKYQQPQQVTRTSYQRPDELEYKSLPKQEAQATVPIQYQPSYLKKGPKYLPDTKEPRYHPLNLGEIDTYQHQQVVNIPKQDQQALIPYEAAIAKLQAEKLNIRQQLVRPQIKYQHQELNIPATATHSLPYPTAGTINQADVADADTEYVRIGQVNRFKPSLASTPPTTYRKPQQNVSVRYYRNSGRPTITYTSQAQYQ